MATGTHRFTIEVTLSDEEYQTLGRGVAGMLAWLHERGASLDWTQEDELRAMLRMRLSDEGRSNKERDQLHRELGCTPTPEPVTFPEIPDGIPDWLRL